LHHSETPALEAQVLLASVLEKSREWVLSHFDEELSPTQTDSLNSLLARLINGEPLPYLTGKRAFYGMDFSVSKDTLIPRPETELLVEEAVQWLLNNPSKRSAIDVGTGSGVIAICLADAIPNLCINAIDVSEEALEIAKKNCFQFHHEDQITFLQGDLLTGISNKVDLITANLPYIPSRTLDTLPELRFEPRLALDGGENGVLYIKKLLEQAINVLKPGGLILLEIESSISELVTQLAYTTFPNAQIDILFDYANLPRIAKILG
jgi:release factor glutamine methyltransferase